MQRCWRSGTAGILSLALAGISGAAQSTLPTDLPSAAAGETGELLLSSLPSQVGTIARRTIRDRSGRVAREAFYSRDVESVSQTEKSLLLRSIRVYYYDATGRVDHVEHWETGRRVLRVEHNAYAPSGNLARTWYVEADGVRRYEMRFEDRTKITDLYFDDTGTYLTSVRGQLVNDVDLPHGWGMTSGGLACAITLSTERGRFEDIAVWVNIKNVATKTMSIDNLVEPSFELRDVEGKEVAAREAGPGIDLSRKVSRAQLDGQLLASGEAGFMYPAYRLADYFGSLAPGQYTIRVCQPVPGRDGRLVSNDVTFVVVQ